MGKHCVLKNDAFYKKAAELNIDSAALENAVHSYINTVDDGSVFPSDAYILEYIFGKPSQKPEAKKLMEDLEKVHVVNNGYIFVPNLQNKRNFSEGTTVANNRSKAEERVVALSNYIIQECTGKGFKPVYCLSNDGKYKIMQLVDEEDIESDEEEVSQTQTKPKSKVTTSLKTSTKKEAVKLKSKPATKQAKIEANFKANQLALGEVISFDAATHTYTVQGKRADYSVTQFKDMVMGIDHSDTNDFLEIASRLGTTHDSILRDFFMGKLAAKYPNASKADIEAISKEGAKLKRALQNKYGKDAVFITDENYLKVAGNVTYNGNNYLVAGTLDMIVIDSNGDIHIVDFKTKRANQSTTLSEEKIDEYGFQTQLYKKLINANENIEGEVKDTRIAQFNLTYADPRTVEYSFKNNYIYVDFNGKKTPIQNTNTNYYTPGVLASIKGLNQDLSYLSVTGIPIPKAVMQTKQLEKETNINTKQANTKQTAKSKNAKVSTAKTISLTNKTYSKLAGYSTTTFKDDKGKSFNSIYQYIAYKKALAVGDFSKAGLILKAKSYKQLNYLEEHITPEKGELTQELEDNITRKALTLAIEQVDGFSDLLLNTGGAYLNHKYRKNYGDILMQLREELGGEPAPTTEQSQEGQDVKVGDVVNSIKQVGDQFTWEDVQAIVNDANIPNATKNKLLQTIYSNGGVQVEGSSTQSQNGQQVTTPTVSQEATITSDEAKELQRIAAKKALDKVNARQVKTSEAENTEQDISNKVRVFNQSADKYSLEQIPNSDKRFTGTFTLNIQDSVKLEKGSNELYSAVDSLPYSSVLSLDTSEIHNSFLYTLNSLLRHPSLYAIYDNNTIDINPNSELGELVLKLQDKNSNILYDRETGKLQVPSFSVGYSLQEIEERYERNQLFNNGYLNQYELRTLSKATMYKLSEYITRIQTYSNGYEITMGEKSDKDFTKMSRIEIINEIGLNNLLLKVRDDIFDSENENARDLPESTIDKMDVIYENWEAFIKLGYDSLIGLEEIALSNKADKVTTIQNEQNGEIENQVEDDQEIVQELFGDSIEAWQVGFRQVSAFSSLSQLIKRKLDTLYVLDKNGEIILNEFGIGDHLSVQEVVSKILKYTQGATSLDAIDSEGNLLGTSMLSLLKSHLNEDPWLRQIIDLLEGKYDEEGNVIKEADEQFKSQFYSNFQKYFQKYAIIFEKKGKKSIKIINESTVAENIVLAAKSRESAFGTGAYHLKNKDGSVNQENLNKLKSYSDRLDKYLDIINKKGEIKNLVKDLDAFHSLIFDIYNILDLDLPSQESINNIFSVKKNINTLATKLDYFLREIDKNAKRSFTNFSEFKAIAKLIAKDQDASMDSVSYEGGKLYYSYVMPSYLNKYVDKLKGKNMSDQEYKDFLQKEFLQYNWFYKDGKVRNHWIKRLQANKECREMLQHTALLHDENDTDYTKKTFSQYAASMMRMYFYDVNKKWAYFRVPIMSNKPSEEYLRFERISTNYKNVITNYLWDTFLQELDRIQAVREREENLKNTPDKKIKNFDKKGKQFVLQSYFQKYLDGSYKETAEYMAADSEERNAADTFSYLLNKKLDDNLDDAGAENVQFLDLFNTIVDKEITNQFQDWKNKLAKEGAFHLNEDGRIEKLKDDNPIIPYTEEEAQEFYWNDIFATSQILEITITDPAMYKDGEDLQKRMAQIHAPGMQVNLNAKYTNKQGEKVLYSKDGIERTMYIKDSIIKSSILPNLKKATEIIINNTPKNRRATVRKQLNYMLKTFNEVNWADAQGFSCPSSYRKKMGLLGNWNDRMEEVYEKVIHPEEYPDVNLSEMLDVLWQPLKPFIYTQIEKPGYNSIMPKLRVGVQNKNSEYTLMIADAIMRRAGVSSKLRAIYNFMEESQHDLYGNLNGEGIDTIQFESTVKVGNTGVIDLNDEYDKNGNLVREKTEEEIDDLLQKAFELDENGAVQYSKDYVHEIPFSDYIIQQNVPAHFMNHQQAQGSQGRILSIADLQDINPETKEPNYLYINGKKVTVAQAKKDYFKAQKENIEESINSIIKRFKLDNLDQRVKNIALSRLLKDAILKDNRLGSDLYWACDTNEYGEFNIPLSDPVQSNRIQQLLNSIIKNNLNKQEIPGGPVVQVSSWGLGNDLNIRMQTTDGLILLTKKEFESGNYPKEYTTKKDKWRQIRKSDKTYEDYIKEQQGIAYMEVLAPIQDEQLIKDFTKVDEEGNEYIDVEAMEEANPQLVEMLGYRIPTESKYSFVPMKIVGFLPRTAGEGIMFPAEITALSGSDFDKH